jgi:3-hydroxybutyrate dehydrogenase
MLKGRTALVTGAGGGLGLVLAECLAAAGAGVVLHDLAAPEAAASRIARQFGVEAMGVAADLRRRAAIEAMMGDLLARCGGIDIVVNNAVVRHFAPTTAFPPERWEEALAVNLSAPFHVARLALPEMLHRGWGRFINMASIYSTRAIANRIDYVTTKAAIVGLTRAIAVETAGTGITCNALCPGTVATPAITGKIAALAAADGTTIEAATRAYLASRQPSGEFVSPQGVGESAVFLCSPAGRQITGAVLPIDDGWSAT